MALSKIKTNSLSDDAVTAAKIAAGTIVAADLAANSVDSSELVDGGVDLSHMSVNSIDSDQYVDGSIDLAHMSVNSIDSDQYVDGSIDLAHMSANSIDSTQYVDGSIDTAHYAAGSVDTTALGADSVTAAKIGDNVIDSEHYAAASIDNEHLADDAVDSDELAAGSVDLAHMSVNSIDSDQYVDGSIDLAHMSVNSIDSDQYVDGSIDTAHIADDQVTLAKMAGLTRGKIIYGDSSGNPAALTVGSSGQALVSDGTDISWGSGGAISTYSNSTNNRVVTSVDSSSVNSEANLLFDGSTLTVTGDLRVQNGTTGSGTSDGLLIQNSGNDVYIAQKENAPMYFRTNNADCWQIAANGYLKGLDNKRISIGTGDDLDIYHDASNTYIRNSTGNLYITDNDGDVHIQGKHGEESIIANNDGSVALYHDNTVKVETTADGAQFGGTVFPTSNDAFDLGKSGAIWRDIYTGDLTLNNTEASNGNDVDGTKGHWKIQEGENDLFIMNKVSGKKFKFKLEEVM